MLIGGLNAKTKKQYQDDHDMYLFACEWSSVKCDGGDRVIEIRINKPNVSGSLDLCDVPPKVRVLRTTPLWRNGKLTGTVALADLPDGMQVIDLRGNELTGEIDLRRLPETMEEVHLEQNQLTGKVDLTRLPEGMQHHSLDRNQLTGEIFTLNYNIFAGEVDLRHLPDGLEFLYLGNNQSTGEINLAQLPDKMGNERAHPEKESTHGDICPKEYIT